MEGQNVQLSGPEEVPPSPDGAVEISDVDLGQMVTVNNNRRIASGFADAVQRDLKGPVKS